MMVISNSVAIVTGGAAGIGRAMVQKLLQRQAKRVILADANAAIGNEAAKQFDREHGAVGRCHFVHCSVTEPSELRRAFDLAHELDGRVDIVANNAGILDETQPDLMIDVNLRGVLHGSQLALQFMSLDRGGSGGVVINTASAAGLFTSAFIPAYSATKHAVVGWTGSMGSHMQFEKHGVRFNCLCPAFIETDMLSSSMQAGSGQTLLSDEQKEKVREFPTIPMDLLIQQFVELIENHKYNGYAVSILPPDKVQFFDKSMKALM